MADIFLSYAREDEARARLLADALVSRGWSVWWDRRIQHGKDFQVVIQAELDAAKCIVVLWSQASIGSTFVRDEATEGRASEGRPDRLVPVLLEAVKPPLGFRGMHNANLIDWRGQAAHEEFDRLLASIESMSPRRPSQSATAVNSPPVAAQPEPVAGRVTGPSGLLAPVADSTSATSTSATTGEASTAPSSGTWRRPPEWAPELQSLFGGTDSDDSTRQPLVPRILRMAFDYRRSVLSVVVALSVAALVMSWPREAAEQGSVEQASTEPTPSPTAGTPVTNPAPGGPQRFLASSLNLPNEPLLGFVEIPAGPFTMGSDKSKDPHAQDEELPQHSVSLPAYFIGRYEVTVGQYTACVHDGGCKPEDRRAVYGDDTLPVRYVSWHEALAYCRWLEGKLKSRAAYAALPFLGTAWHVTLPSEAEWEKAARGTDGRIYPWGASIDHTHANYLSSDVSPKPVGSYPAGASPYGLLDMIGNLWEWTRSHYRDYPYRSLDGREDLSAGNDIFRVVRGGSFDPSDRPGSVSAARRDRHDPNYRYSSQGFRVVVSPSSPAITGAKS